MECSERFPFFFSLDEKKKQKKSWPVYGFEENLGLISGKILKIFKLVWQWLLKTATFFERSDFL